MKRVIISVVLLFVIAGLFLVSINGIRPHPYTEAELETVFLEKAEEMVFLWKKAMKWLRKNMPTA